MLLKGLFTNTSISKQIFQIVFLISIFFSVMASPIERRDTDFIPKHPNITNILSVEQKVISDLKLKILQKLNLKEVPKFNSSFGWNSVTEQIKALAYKQGLSFDETEESPKSMRESMIISLTKINQCVENFSNNQECLDLTIPNMNNKNIISAKLILPLTQLAFDISVEDNISYNITINNLPESVYSLSVDNVNSNSLTIDWTTILKKLLNIKDNLENKQNTFSFIVSIGGDNKTVPVEQIIDLDNIVLEIQYQTEPKLVRKRRETNNCVQNQYFCCTQSLKVSIDDLGWSQFIFAPRTFNINYCRGDCNAYITHSSNHARALNFARAKGVVAKKNLRACCVPYSYSNLTIMYRNQENSVEVSTVNDLIATTCGCM